MLTDRMYAVLSVKFTLSPNGTLPLDIEAELHSSGSKPLVAKSVLQELSETEVSILPELTALDPDAVDEAFKAQRKSRRTQ